MSTLADDLRQGPSAFAARRKGGHLPVDQRGATLSQLFFAKVDLSGLDLSNAEFDGCTIGGVDFRGTSLEGAYLHDGRFERCDFRGAKFAGASLERIEFVDCTFDERLDVGQVELDEVSGFGAAPAPVEPEPLVEEPKFVAGHVAVNDVLERELEANPDDARRWLVYGDWLQSEGDVRGELITRHGKEGFDAFVREHAEVLFPGFADELRGGGQLPEVELEFRHGLIHGATLQALNRDRPVDLAALAHRVLEAPASRFLRRLSYGLLHDVQQYGERRNDYEPIVASLIREPKLARLTHLAFGVQDREPISDLNDGWPQLHGFGDLGALWAHVPHLETLEVKGSDGVLGDVHLPSLRSARFEFDNPEAEAVNEVLTARWPKLSRFELWELDDTNVEPLLETLRPLALTHLALPRLNAAHHLLTALLRSPLLPRLKVLDLHDSAFDASAVELLEKNIAKFRHLEQLVLTDAVDSTHDDQLARHAFVVLKEPVEPEISPEAFENEDGEWEAEEDDEPDEAFAPEAPNADLDIPDEHGD
ncbi:MAG: pentapeptide repeat-containing protein [Myxococcaceae bacterium]